MELLHVCNLPGRDILLGAQGKCHSASGRAGGERKRRKKVPHLQLDVSQNGGHEAPEVRPISRSMASGRVLVGIVIGLASALCWLAVRLYSL